MAGKKIRKQVLAGMVTLLVMLALLPLVSGAEEEGTLKWTFEIGSSVSSPAIGADGTIYVGAGDGSLYAVEPDGTEKWVFKTGNSIYTSPAIAPDGTIYIGLLDTNLYAINPDGTEKWRFKADGSIYSSPAIGADGTIYVGAFKSIYAINPDGTEKWKFETGWVESSPAIALDGTIYIGSSENSNLYALYPDGTQQWDFLTQSQINSSPAIGSDGTVYIGSRDNNLYAVNPDKTQKWAFKTNDSIDYASPVIGTDGTVYIGSKDNYLYAINPDGTQKWAFETGDDIDTTPVIGADGIIYAGSNDGNIYAVNPDGTKRWELKTGSWINSCPVIASDGTLYVASLDGKLYAINTSSKGVANSSWSMFHRDIKHTGRVSSCPDSVKIKGTVLYGDIPLCAMVLANGQHIFSCAGDGKYELENVPLDENGQITLFAFCEGLKPFKTVMTPCDEQPIEMDILMEPELNPKEMILTRDETTVLDSGWVKISGTATYEGMPLNIMVLANGQYMFTLPENGKYELIVPLDANGEITLFGFCDGLQPFKEVFKP